ncbi:MAG: preprotein translocase subunit SecE [Gammaproteobacteria bacterium]|nr:preprotein translocase subunit SecE [Gammaproteobacteria bacterium]
MKKDNGGEKQFHFDWLKWIVVVVLLSAGVYANYHYAQIAWSLRAVGWILLVVIMALIASQTLQGMRAWGFVKSARVELRKVVWPNRQETVQTTLIVVVMVVITAIVLWGLDNLFLWLVGLLTGQRG